MGLPSMRRRPLHLKHRQQFCTSSPRFLRRRDQVDFTLCPNHILMLITTYSFCETPSSSFPQTAEAGYILLSQFLNTVYFTNHFTNVNIPLEYHIQFQTISFLSNLACRFSDFSRNLKYSVCRSCTSCLTLGSWQVA